MHPSISKYFLYDSKINNVNNLLNFFDVCVIAEI